jgi:hypothetical protein
MKELWKIVCSKVIRWFDNWGNPETRDFRYTLWFFYLVISGALIAVGAYNSGRGAVTPLLWALACLIGGVFAGFLFGIPKILQSDLSQLANNAGDTSTAESRTYRQQVNTNLTEISDWLTKIIVGLGLINLREIPSLIKKSALILAASMHEGGPDQDHLAYAVAIIVSFSILGFLFGYLITRIYLAGVFSKVDRDVNRPPTPKLPAAVGSSRGTIVDFSGSGKDIQKMELSGSDMPEKAYAPNDLERKTSAYYLRHSAERAPSLDKDQRRYYRLKFWLDADEAGMLNNVEKVVYVLHPTFKNPIREIFLQETAFEMNTIAWGEFNLKAIVYLKEGGTPITLERYIDFGESS